MSPLLFVSTIAIASNCGESFSNANVLFLHIFTQRLQAARSVLFASLCTFYTKFANSTERAVCNPKIGKKSLRLSLLGIISKVIFPPRREQPSRRLIQPAFARQNASTRETTYYEYCSDNRIPEAAAQNNFFKKKKKSLSTHWPKNVHRRNLYFCKLVFANSSHQSPKPKSCTSVRQIISNTRDVIMIYLMRQECAQPLPEYQYVCSFYRVCNLLTSCVEGS